MQQTEKRRSIAIWLTFALVASLVLYSSAYFAMMRTTGYVMTGSGEMLERDPVYVWEHRDVPLGNQGTWRMVFAPARQVHLLARKVW